MLNKFIFAVSLIGFLAVNFPAQKGEKDVDILSANYHTAENALSKGITEKDKKNLRLGLKSRFPEIIQKDAGAVASLDDETFIPDLVEALKLNNQCVTNGGTETAVCQVNLNKALISALEKLTSLTFYVSDSPTHEDIENIVMQSNYQWSVQKKHYVSELQNDKLKCGNVVDDFQLCTETTDISVKLGNSINIPLILKNMSDQTVILNRNYLLYKTAYSLTLTGADGHQFLSKDEELEIYYKNHPEASGIQDLPIYSGPGFLEIKPQQWSGTEIPLNYLYEIKCKGKYQVRITRKLPKRTGNGDVELSFGTIEVEVN